MVTVVWQPLRNAGVPSVELLVGPEVVVQVRSNTLALSNVAGPPQVLVDIEQKPDCLPDGQSAAGRTSARHGRSAVDEVTALQPQSRPDGN